MGLENETHNMPSTICFHQIFTHDHYDNYGQTVKFQSISLTSNDDAKLYFSISWEFFAEEIMFNIRVPIKYQQSENDLTQNTCASGKYYHFSSNRKIYVINVPTLHYTEWALYIGREQGIKMSVKVTNAIMFHTVASIFKAHSGLYFFIIIFHKIKIVQRSLSVSHLF